MSKYLKVEGHDHLVRESSSHAIINADNVSEFEHLHAKN